MEFIEKLVFLEGGKPENMLKNPHTLDAELAIWLQAALEGTSALTSKLRWGMGSRLMSTV